MNADTLEKLKPFIYGKMLGDATIERTSKPTHNNIFRVKQKADHKEYVEQCWRKIHNHCGQMYLSGSRREHKGITKTHYAWVFKAKAHPVWTNLRKQWYAEDGSKLLPSDLEKHFNAELLAYWFMDDGYKTNNAGANQRFLATQSFTSEQVDFLVDLLNLKFDLGAVKVKDRVDSTGVLRYLIRFSGRPAAEKLYNLIEAFVPECLRYKIRTP
jgi:hypothetical protein